MCVGVNVCDKQAQELESHGVFACHNDECTIFISVPK